MQDDPSTETLIALHELCAPLAGYICPLYAKDRGRGFLLGTGVPLRFANVAIIATASHVLKEFGNRQVYTLGRDDVLPLTGQRRLFEHRGGETIDVDLALIVLSSADTAELESRFSFTCYSDFALAQPTDEFVLYVLAGYPGSKNKPTPRSHYELTATAAYFVSRSLHQMEQSPLTGKHAHVHFAMPAAAENTRSIIGGPATTPKPHGMSGGGVWCLRLDRADNNWQTRFVGIGIEYDRASSRFVCTSIQHILPMVEGLAS